MFEYGTGIVDDVQVFAAGERSICVVRFHVGNDPTVYASRSTPLNPGLQFLKCRGLQVGDQVTVRVSDTDTEIDWARL